MYDVLIVVHPALPPAPPSPPHLLLGAKVKARVAQVSKIALRQKAGGGNVHSFRLKD